jgi:uncharacterized protein YjiS (DUF1127 family)
MNSQVIVRQAGKGEFASTRAIARRWRAFVDRAVSAAPNLFRVRNRSRKAIPLDGLSDHILSDIGLSRPMLDARLADQVSRRHE